MKLQTVSDFGGYAVLDVAVVLVGAKIAYWNRFNIRASDWILLVPGTSAFVTESSAVVPGGQVPVDGVVRFRGVLAGLVRPVGRRAERLIRWKVACYHAIHEVPLLDRYSCLCTAAFCVCTWKRECCGGYGNAAYAWRRFFFAAR